MINPVLSQSFYLSVGECNAEKEMAVTLLTAKIIDIATAHANILGIGNPDMAQLNCGWVLSRLTIEMNRWPKADSHYSISTWVESWNRHFSSRCFAISDVDGNILGYARSIWMVINTITHENAGLSHLSLPENIILPEDKCPIPRQERHNIITTSYSETRKKELPANEPVTTHTFLYTDLDAYRHVNTVRYVSLLLNQFSLESFDSSFVRRLELSFLHEAHYRTPIEILQHYDKTNLASSFYLRDKKTESPILYARILRKPRL